MWGSVTQWPEIGQRIFPVEIIQEYTVVTEVSSLPIPLKEKLEGEIRKHLLLACKRVCKSLSRFEKNFFLSLRKITYVNFFRTGYFGFIDLYFWLGFGFEEQQWIIFGNMMMGEIANKYTPNMTLKDVCSFVEEFIDGLPRFMKQRFV